MEFCSLFYHKFLKKVNSFFQIYDKKERSPVFFRQIPTMSSASTRGYSRPGSGQSRMGVILHMRSGQSQSTRLPIPSTLMSVPFSSIVLVEQMYESSVIPHCSHAWGTGSSSAKYFPGIFRCRECAKANTLRYKSCFSN